MDSLNNELSNRQESCRKAIIEREYTIKTLNEYFLKMGGDITIEFLNEHKLVGDTEVMKSNKIENRYDQMGNTLGLTAVVKSKLTGKKLMLEIRYKSQSTLYQKKPTNIELDDYLINYLSDHYYLILDKNNKEYHLISIKDILKIFTPRLEKYEGNKNRITFYCKTVNRFVRMDDFKLISIEKGESGFLFIPNLYEQLKIELK